MATIAADLEGLSKAISSQTTIAETDFDNADTEKRQYCFIDSRVEIGAPDLPATALVIQPFVVELIPRETGYLAISDISNAYELGATAGQALRNYLELLVDELLWLQKNEEQLSPSIQEDLRLLQRYLRIV